MKKELVTIGIVAAAGASVGGLVTGFLLTKSNREIYSKLEEEKERVLNISKKIEVAKNEISQNVQKIESGLRISEKYIENTESVMDQKIEMVKGQCEKIAEINKAYINGVTETINEFKGQTESAISRLVEQERESMKNIGKTTQAAKEVVADVNKEENESENKISKKKVKSKK